MKEGDVWKSQLKRLIIYHFIVMPKDPGKSIFFKYSVNTVIQKTVYMSLKDLKTEGTRKIYRKKNAEAQLHEGTY